MQSIWKMTLKLKKKKSNEKKITESMAQHGLYVTLWASRKGKEIEVAAIEVSER